MHLSELAEITESEIVVNYLHQRRLFFASLKGVEVVEDGSLKTVFGQGRSPESAQRDFSKRIAGKRVIHGQREFAIPRNINF